MMWSSDANLENKRLLVQHFLLKGLAELRSQGLDSPDRVVRRLSIGSLASIGFSTREGLVRFVSLFRQAGGIE